MRKQPKPKQLFSKYAYDLWGLISSNLLYPYAERHLKRVISPKLKILRREAVQPFCVRKALARERLAQVLEHAGQTVPYYRDLFKSRNFDPARIRQDERYLQELPYLTKDILREQGRRLLSETYAEAIVREQKTGSSTGPAAIIYYDQTALDWTAAQNIQVLEWSGKRRYNREAHLSTRFQTPPPLQAARFEARKCLVLNRFNIYTDGFDDASQERLLADLRQAKARLVQGHPSNLYALARYLKKNGQSGAGLFDIFVSTGEMIAPNQRALIEEVLQVRVSDRYGACEFGVMAQELERGPKSELLVCDSLVWPEVRAVDQSGLVGGELVFTNLRNLAMPLIRYCLGDLGTLRERANGWWITELIGRTHDAVEINGQICPTHYLQDILDRCGPIIDFQLVVKEGKAMELRLVAEPGPWEDIENSVKACFPGLPVRRIERNELVFVGIRGKFSYLLREDA